MTETRQPKKLRLSCFSCFRTFVRWR